MDAADTALMIQVLERLLNDDSFLDDEIKKEIKQYDNDGNLKIDRGEFQVTAGEFGRSMQSGGAGSLTPQNVLILSQRSIV